MKKTLFYKLSLVIVSLFIFSCGGNETVSEVKEENHENEHSEAVEHKEDCSHVHWSHHSGDEGPENWKNLCDGFNTCGGEVQSPIDIVTTQAESSSDLSSFIFNYDSSNVDIINNGHTVQFNVSGEQTVIIGNKVYNLLQFHYHASSEHTVNGKHFPLEVHFVHKHSDDDFAVLGIMFEEGEEYPLFTKYLSEFPTSKGTYENSAMINLASLFPSDLDYFNYSGSLTTPPCSEVVNWFVLKNPVTASKEQIEMFAEILHSNYRPVMPLNSRKIFSFED